MTSNRIGELARHTGFYGLGTIAGGLARAALVPIIARFLSTDEYGKASVTFIFMNLLGIVTELGFGSSLIRFFNEAPDEKEQDQVAATVFVASSGLVVFSTAICILFSQSLSTLLLGSPLWRNLIVVGAIGGGGNALLQIGLSFERARARSLRYTVLTVAKGACALALSLALVAYLRAGALGLVIGTAIPTAAIGLLIYWQRISRFGKKISKQLLKGILDFGIPLVPVGLAMWVLSYSDVYLLRKLLPPEKSLSQVGLYQFAHEICLLLVLPITAFNLAWPQFIFSNHRRPDAKRLFADVQIHFTLILIEIALILALFSDRIVDLVGSEAYQGSVEVIPLLAGSLVFYGLSIVFSSGLYISGKTRTLGLVVTFCAALNVVLNIYFIPRIGKVGAALATLITDAVMAFSLLTMASRTYAIPFRLGRTVAALAIAGSLILATSLLSGAEGYSIRILAFTGLSIFLPFLLSTSWKQLFSIFKELRGVRV